VKRAKNSKRPGAFVGAIVSLSPLPRRGGTAVTIWGIFRGRTPAHKIAVIACKTTALVRLLVDRAPRLLRDRTPVEAHDLMLSLLTNDAGAVKGTKRVRINEGAS
jgi:hypothetical protein